MKLPYAACFALLFIPVAARADRVDDLIKKQMETQKIPGVAVLITKDDKVVKSAGYGEADLELHVKMKPTMVFESGSIGKTFTATVILQLWEQGKIALDDPLSKYIDKIPDLWKPITIRRLLTHTSGLKDYALVDGLGLAGKWTNQDWFDKMSVLPLDFPTGRQFAYSNSNYLLLGLVADKITGKSIDDLRIERVFKPLGMNHTYTADDSAIIPDRSKGYWPTSEGGLINEIRIVEGYGDGSEMNDCEDLAKFERGIREGKLLKPETVKLMQTSERLPNGRKSGYGFGWFTHEVYGHHYVSHGGNTGGFGVSMTRIPDKKLTIIVMTNLASVSGDGFAQQIAAAFDPSLAPKKLVESTDPDPALTAKLKAVLAGLANGDSSQDIFDEDYATGLATARGKTSLEQFGSFKTVSSFAFCSKEPDDIDTAIRYRVKTPGHQYIVGFWVTAEGKVHGVALRREA